LFRVGGSFGDNETPLFEMSEYNFVPHKNTGEGQCLVGSFTGEVGSYNATEPCNGWLILNGNQDLRINAKASLTARPTSRAGTKVGVSDPPMLSGKHGA
jgi:hypothetical protein